MNRTLLTLSGIVFLMSCAKGDRQDASAVEQAIAVPANNAEAVSLNRRTQFDLAAAIRLIEQEKDDDERAFSLETLTKSWQGERYAWTVNVLSAFCPNEDGCHVVPFDRGGKDKAIVQGWSPQLKLSSAQWQRISSSCAGAEGSCRLTFEGTLSNFRISTEELTRLTFSDVALIAVGDEVAL